MCKAILMMLLIFVCSNTVAEWVQIGSIDAFNLIIYANPDTILNPSDINKPDV